VGGRGRGGKSLGASKDQGNDEGSPVRVTELVRKLHDGNYKRASRRSPAETRRTRLKIVGPRMRALPSRSVSRKSCLRRTARLFLENQRLSDSAPAAGHRCEPMEDGRGPPPSRITGRLVNQEGSCARTLAEELSEPNSPSSEPAWRRTRPAAACLRVRNNRWPLHDPGTARGHGHGNTNARELVNCSLRNSISCNADRCLRSTASVAPLSRDPIIVVASSFLRDGVS